MFSLIEWLTSARAYTSLLSPAILFMLVTGFLPDFASTFTVLDNINGKQYMLSDNQLQYSEINNGCAAINASLALLDTNDDFMALRKALSLDDWSINVVIWVNIHEMGHDSDTHYFWGKEQVDSSLWWPDEPNKQGASYLDTMIAECRDISHSCRPVIMTRVRAFYSSSYHQLMDTCCLYSKYYLCRDNNECNLHGDHLCPPNSYCSNTPGSYTCVCYPGFQMQSEICQDIDECDFHDTDLCPGNSYCTNTPGNYSCLCPSGFQMTSDICQDINECHSGNICPDGSLCHNTFGSYYCACNQGYSITHRGNCEEVLSRPYITLISPVAPLKLGDDVVLSCERGSPNANQTATITYMWLKDNTPLNTTDGVTPLNTTDGVTPLNTTDGVTPLNTTDGVLQLHLLREDDYGSFQCLKVKDGNLWSAPSIPFILTASSGPHEATNSTRVCPCLCHGKSYTNSSDWSTATVIYSQMRIDRLSSYIRARSSIQDWRLSSVATGSTAIIFLLSLLSTLVVGDCVNVVRYVSALYGRSFTNLSVNSSIQK